MRFERWLLPVILLLGGCVTVTLWGDRPPWRAAEGPSGPRFDHGVHLDQDIDCLECHESDEATEAVRLPGGSSCLECHDADEFADPTTASWFQEVVSAGDAYAWPRILGRGGLRNAHPAHLDQELECATCHPGAAENDFLPGGLFAWKNTCRECHDEIDDENCAYCHRDIRKDEPPAWHGEPGFLSSHGENLGPRWRAAGWMTCDFCHERDACASCHETTRPPSHTALWTEGHAIEVEHRGGNRSCSTCHAARDCQECHQVQRPPSHTQTFVRRTHGMAVNVSRSRCTSCHRQDFCERCHESSAPTSHRGSFASARATHCLQCHEPLGATTCNVCHNTTIGHVTAAPRLPDDGVHPVAGECLVCHIHLTHENNGDGPACRACHR